MHKFVRSLITEWRRLGLPFSGGGVVVAVSGGADSVSLLLALAELKKRKKLDLRLIVAHFDHGLRGKESVADERFVAELAAGLGFEYVGGKGKVARSGNLEQNARAARYDFLLKTAKKHETFGVLTAHTQNDQAETLLMNLIRGSGIEGLAAMPPVRAFKDSDVLLVRPLLRWATREETEAFCGEAGVEFREDAMNRDPAFSRVRIRKEVIPLLRTFNPKIVASLARTAGLLAANSEEASKMDAGPLSLSDLKALPQAELYRRLRAWIRHNRGNLRGIQLIHIEAIEGLVHSRKSGKTVELPGFFVVTKSGGNLSIADIKVEK